MTIAWIARDEQSAYADATLAAVGGDMAFVPPIWQWEIANVLLILERRMRLSDASAALTRVLRLPIEVENTEDRRTSRALLELDLARKHGLSAYDAAYLATAMRIARPLATLDRQLATAARAEAILFEPV